MPAVGSPILPWVDRSLKAAGHPACARIVTRGRRQTPRKSWDAIAREISALAGGDVSGEWVRLNFSHLDPAQIDGAAQ